MVNEKRPGSFHLHACGWNGCTHKEYTGLIAKVGQVYTGNHLTLPGYEWQFNN